MVEKLQKMKRLREDRNGFVGGWITGLIGVLIVILVGLALLGPIQDAIAGANVTGASLALLQIVPLLVIVAIVLLVVFWAIARYESV